MRTRGFRKIEGLLERDEVFGELMLSFGRRLFPQHGCQFTRDRPIAAPRRFTELGDDAS